MEVDLNYRPRLHDMRLADSRSALSAVEDAIERRRRGPAVTLADSFEGRDGYDEGFLSPFEVPMPVPTGRRAGDVLSVPGSTDNRLDYMHFSVVMSESRRIAMFVAVNIDGSQTKKIDRSDPDKWFLDGRIPVEAQVGEELYADNLLDRGHLVRREDPNWGGDAQIANDDTFHFTNCAPQMGAFNQKTWLSLEDYVLKTTRVARARVTVFTGPVFGDDDRLYRGIRIPTAFWKVIAFVDDEGRPSATAYMVDQIRELRALEVTFGAFRTYQRSVRQIEELTDLDFGALADFDGFSNEELATGTRIEAWLRDAGEMRI